MLRRKCCLRVRGDGGTCGAARRAAFRAAGLGVYRAGRHRGRRSEIARLENRRSGSRAAVPGRSLSDDRECLQFPSAERIAQSEQAHKTAVAKMPLLSSYLHSLVNKVFKRKHNCVKAPKGGRLSRSCKPLPWLDVSAGVALVPSIEQAAHNMEGTMSGWWRTTLVRWATRTAFVAGALAPALLMTAHPVKAQVGVLTPLG